MAERAILERTILPTEAAVLRQTLQKAATSQSAETFFPIVDQLRVTGQCSCGCDSVDFASLGPRSPAKVIADGIGETPLGGKVGIMVWATLETIACLEICDLGAGAGDEDLRLPKPESIAAWGKDGA